MLLGKVPLQAPHYVRMRVPLQPIFEPQPHRARYVCPRHPGEAQQVHHTVGSPPVEFVDNGE